MKNQFFYSKKEMLPPQEGDTEPKFFEGLDSFSLEKVIRSISIPNGQRLVLLDDLHERVHEVQIRNQKGNVTSIKRERDAFQSEIYLSPIDSARFMEITSDDSNSIDYISKYLANEHS